jgi:hypothetical protein
MGTDDTTYCTQAKYGVSYVLRGGWDGKAKLKAYQWADEGRQLCIGSNSTFENLIDAKTFARSMGYIVRYQPTLVTKIDEME